MSSSARRFLLSTGLSLAAGVLGALAVITPVTLGVGWPVVAASVFAMAAIACAYAAGVNTERALR